MLDSHHSDAYAAAFLALGRLHRQPPDADTLATLGELLDEWPLPDTEDGRRGILALRRSVEIEEDAELIRRDHDRLYGVSAKAAVSPYESVHRGVEHLVFDEATLQVRDAYRELGLQAPLLNREPDDHIGLEFDFLARALLEAGDLLEAGEADAAQHRLAIAETFLRNHLLPWAPAMLQQVTVVARTHFMQGIGWLSLGALASYQAALDAPAG